MKNHTVLGPLELFRKDQECKSDSPVPPLDCLSHWTVWFQICGVFLNYRICMGEYDALENQTVHTNSHIKMKSLTSNFLRSESLKRELSINSWWSKKYASVLYNCCNAITCFFQNKRLVIIYVRWVDRFTIIIELNTCMRRSIFVIIWASNTDEVFMMFWREKCACSKIFMLCFFFKVFISSNFNSSLSFCTDS